MVSGLKPFEKDPFINYDIDSDDELELRDAEDCENISELEDVYFYYLRKANKSPLLMDFWFQMDIYQMMKIRKINKNLIISPNNKNFSFNNTSSILKIILRELIKLWMNKSIVIKS